MFSLHVVICSLYILCFPIVHSKPFFGLCDVICDDDSSSSDDDDDDWDLCSGCNPRKPTVTPTTNPSLTTLQVLLTPGTTKPASSNLRINGTQSNGLFLVPGYWQFVPNSESPPPPPPNQVVTIQRPLLPDVPPGSLSQFTGSQQPQQILTYYPGLPGQPAQGQVVQSSQPGQVVQGGPYPNQFIQSGLPQGQFIQNSQVPNQFGGQVPGQFIQGGQLPGQIIPGGQVFPSGQIPQGVPIAQIPVQQLPGQPAVQVGTPPTATATPATAAAGATPSATVAAPAVAAPVPAATTG